MNSIPNPEDHEDTESQDGLLFERPFTINVEAADGFSRTSAWDNASAKTTQSTRDKLTAAEAAQSKHTEELNATEAARRSE